MAKMTLQDLKKLRESKQQELERRDVAGKTVNIVIGMGTCGIAAGAKDTLDTFIKVLNEKNLNYVTVTQSGCMGLCYAEPTVEVIAPDMPKTIYGKVDAEVAKQIVAEHIEQGRLVENHVYDRPSADILGDA